MYTLKVITRSYSFFEMYGNSSKLQASIVATILKWNRKFRLAVPSPRCSNKIIHHPMMWGVWRHCWFALCSSCCWWAAPTDNLCLTLPAYVGGGLALTLQHMVFCCCCDFAFFFSSFFSFNLPVLSNRVISALKGELNIESNNYKVLLKQKVYSCAQWNVTQLIKHSHSTGLGVFSTMLLFIYCCFVRF